jgi:transcriptional regulator with XRE-family HTH domain
MDGHLSQDAGTGPQDFDNEDIVELGSSIPKAGLHRLAAARRESGMSWFDIARRIGITAEEVRLQEESVDLSISTLNLWAAALDVPVTDLIVEPEEWLHATHLAKSQAERLLQLAAKLRDGSRRRSIQRLAQTFLDQLAEMQPALGRHVNGHERGRSSTSSLRANGSRSIGRKRERPE